MHTLLTRPRFLLNLSLIVLLLAACAPAAVTTEEPAKPAAPAVVAPSATPAAESPAVEAASTEVPAATPLPVATSRGPDLEATDPGTVSLASGNLHFVEFFRFT